MVFNICCGSDIYFDDRKFEAHLRSPKHASGIPCGTCGACFETQDLLYQHHQNNFHLTPPLSRQIPKQPARKPPLQPQKLAQPTSTFHCRPCKRHFADQRAFESHLESAIHNFRCQNCGVRCADRASLNQHLLSVHMGKSRVQTPQPQSHAPTQSQPPPPPPPPPRQPQTFTHPVPHQQHSCNICHATFNTHHALDQHRSAVHGPRNPLHNKPPARTTLFTCTVCAKSFTNQYALDQHLVSDAHPGRGQKRTKAPVYTCEECGRTFDVKDLLTLHAASHVRYRWKL
ncbi:hypothetical protein Q9L58_006977 [Maublancomyces gigas]|uniref:C2H2-type domain-containing protein n=1 Tax=Discina gigas TaxID=1032678 RepID=A0ABR3GE24_9PEZI